MELLANIDGVIGDAARGLAVVPNPFARRRRVEPVSDGTVCGKLRGQAGRVFGEIELESIDHVLAPFEPAREVVFGQVPDNCLSEFVDEKENRQRSQVARGRGGHGTHRVSQKSGDVRHMVSSSRPHERRSSSTSRSTLSPSPCPSYRRMSSSARAKSRWPKRSLLCRDSPYPHLHEYIIRTYVRSVKDFRASPTR